MSRLGLALVVSLATLVVAPTAWAEEPTGIQGACCTTDCHGKETKALRASVHATALTCIDCHEALRHEEGSHATWQERHRAGEAGFTGTPAREDVPVLCNSCHGDPVRMHAYALRSDQLTQYRISAHGRALFERGNTRAAVCIDCHGAHGILAVANPRSATAKANLPETCGRCHADEALMTASGLSTDTVERYVEGVHGRALLEHGARAAPSCADCHGSHGASPPGVGELVEVCGRCHVKEKELYRTSPHFTSGEMSCKTCHEDDEGYAYGRTGCGTCHATHEIAAPGPHLYEGDAPGHCGHCHRQGDEARAFAAVVADGRTRLDEGLDETLRLIEDGKARGLWFEHEDSYRRQSKRTLVKAGSLIHALDAARVEKHFDSGVAEQEQTRETIVKMSAALRDRRILLSVLVLLLLLLAALLSMKLRAIRRLS